jgi:hypothetical protein
VVGSDHANFIFILKDPNHTTFEISLGAWVPYKSNQKQ